ncbi:MULTISPECIES: CHASE2 domain-containing protein [unclassified Prochlorococcus]|uniref:CHASE2 domain-containing protein n=1 Tax=unclassified Prochlorococcus TaxID=2627481 RepID=UPI00210144D8|nr:MULTISPECIES: CHASE2 domain-containing protein [unclassified Prochlorococcus]
MLLSTATFWQTNLAQSFDLIIYDLVSEAGPTRSNEEDPITMISISESSSNYLCWPIDDQKLCNAIDPLTNTGVSTIGLDRYRNQSPSTTRQWAH